MKKPAYLALFALVIIIAVVVAIASHDSRTQNSQSANRTTAQQPLMIDNSISPTLQTPSSGLNPQPSSTSSMPGATWLDDGYGSGTSYPPTSPCNTCKPGYGRVCPLIACPISQP